MSSSSKQKTNPFPQASGLEILDSWKAVQDIKWSASERRWMRENKPFWFRHGRDLIIVKDNRVGNLKQWARAVGISYASAVLRKARGLPIGEILNPAHGHLIEHSFWSAGERAKCNCSACKQFTWLSSKTRPKPRLDPSAPFALDELEAGAPEGVAEPSEWRKHGAQLYLVRYREQFKPLVEWASELGIKYKTLHARLIRDGMPIEKAMQVSLVSIKHGTRNAYLTHKCRCSLCRQANSNYHRGLSLRKKGQPGMKSS